MKRMFSTLLSAIFATTAIGQNLSSAQECFTFARKDQILTVRNPDGQVQHVDFDNAAFKGKAIAFTYSAKKKTVHHETDQIRSSVQVFPNPAFGNVNVVLDRSWNLPVRMEIWDKNGNAIKTQSLETEKTLVNIDSFSRGIYMIKLQAGHSSAMHKLVVQ